MRSKVKVRVDDLLVAVRARREKAKYDEKALEARAHIAAALRAAADKAERGEIPDYSYREIRVPYKRTVPVRPTLNTAAIDRLIQTLEMASDHSIAISAEDAAQYLG